MTSVPAAARLQAILIWSIALLAVLFLVWPVWRAFFPMEIWGNEGWNAYHADAAMRGAAQLYPPTDGLIANNYPPLSYYVIGWLGRWFGDPLYVGRAVSILSTLAIGAAAAAAVRQLGGSRAAGLIAGFWFVATMSRFFEFYVGMNEPQLFGLAVMSAGFAWFLRRHAQGAFDVAVVGRREADRDRERGACCQAERQRRSVLERESRARGQRRTGPAAQGRKSPKRVIQRGSGCGEWRPA